MRYLRWPATAALVGLVAVLLGYGVLVQHAGRGIDHALADGQRPSAPALRLPRLGAPGMAGTADWRGHVVVVNFWASWCGPCRDESPLLERWQRRLTADGGLVLGVDTVDAVDDALGFAHQMRLTYPQLHDRDGSTARRFGVNGYPETLVLDRRGRIAAVRRGPVDDAFMRARVQPLLKEAA